MSTPFKPEWLQPGAVVPVDIPTLAAFAEELRRLHAENQTLRAALDAAVAWAAPMADAPKSSRPEWFDQARAAIKEINK